VLKTQSLANDIQASVERQNVH